MSPTPTAAEPNTTDSHSQSATLLERALLGIVAFEPSSGYDVKKLFEETPMGIFSSSPGAIYPALARLEEQGWLSSRLEPQHTARPRRVYSITAAGESVLVAWLREGVTVEELREGQGLDAALLRFSFAEYALGRQDGIQYLESFRTAVERYRAELRTHLETLDFGPLLHPRLALEHGVAALEASLEWIDHALDALRSTPEPPATADRT